MDTDDRPRQPEGAAAEPVPPLDPEEAKKQAWRKLKPVGPIMKPLTEEEINELLGDPEIKERDHLLDAMPKGQEIDDQDPF